MKLSHVIAVAAGLIVIATSSSEAQQMVNRTVNVSGTTCSYVVYIPTNFNAAENMPVMMFFHGGGSTANTALQFECDFRSLADSKRFLAVYPKAFNSTSGSNSWDCLGNYYGGIDEMGFTTAMIDALVSEFNADDQRILSDPEREVAEAYAILKGKNASWVTFFIGKDGKILHIDNKVSVRSHGADVAAKLKELGVDER